MKLKKILKEKQNILSVYFTAGYPQIDDTASIIQELEKSGADLIEVGIPFSDPLADGETIQKSSAQALKNGINLDIVFRQLQAIKGKIHVPLILMGYLNQLLAYGEEKFLEKCQSSGIQALIIPDLPVGEYQKRYEKLFKSYGLSTIFLISPHTEPERIRLIDKLSDSFIYMVSSSSVTGAKADISSTQVAYFERVKSMNLKNPCLIGFGISNKKTFAEACRHARGAIIGSAFIKKISEKGNLKEQIAEFIQTIID